MSWKTRAAVFSLSPDVLEGIVPPVRIPKFWARAASQGFEAPGWSFTSLDEAKRVAAERVKVLADVLKGLKSPEGRYLYGDRPVREPVIQTIGDVAKPEALITRNSYGALCLNTEEVAFVDVDNGDVNRVKAAQARQPGWALRVYKTKAGMRVVAMHARLSPNSPEAAKLFETLGADPLYIKLCAVQQSFRARLTPKPWRMGLVRMPGSFPWRDQGVEQRVGEWVNEYDNAREEYAVCELVGVFGAAAADPTIERIVTLHDKWVLSPGKELA